MGCVKLRGEKHVRQSVALIGSKDQSFRRVINAKGFLSLPLSPLAFAMHSENDGISSSSPSDSDDVAKATQIEAYTIVLKPNNLRVELKL